MNTHCHVFRGLTTHRSWIFSRWIMDQGSGLELHRVSIRARLRASLRFLEVFCRVLQGACGSRVDYGWQSSTSGLGIRLMGLRLRLGAAMDYMLFKLIIPNAYISQQTAYGRRFGHNRGHGFSSEDTATDMSEPCKISEQQLNPASQSP